MIDLELRYQKGLTLNDLFPKEEGQCACGCGQALTGRRTKWASRECNDKAYVKFAILKGNNGVIRKELFKRDLGYCHNCGVYDSNWEADHIISVFKGGGACELDNFQTLCQYCHKQKTNTQRESHRNAISSHEAVNASTLLL